MPDRAVVDEREAFLDRHPGAWLGFALEEAIPKLKQQAIEEYIASQPRALCAVSEDRQWLVVHSNERCVGFDIYKLVKDRWKFSYEPLNWPQIEDTGQDAHEVLRVFLDGQEGDDDA